MATPLVDAARWSPPAGTQRQHPHRIWSSASSSSSAFDQLYAGDITYIPTDEGFCYLAGVLDACSKRMVGWSIAAHLPVSCATAASFGQPDSSECFMGSQSRLTGKARRH
jgi:transposase InsO family protein